MLSSSDNLAYKAGRIAFGAYGSLCERMPVMPASKGIASGQRFVMPVLGREPKTLEEAVLVLQDMKRKLGEGNGTYRIAAAVTVRPLANTLLNTPSPDELGFDYDTRVLEPIMEASLRENVALAFYFNGAHWQSVGNSRAPAIDYLWSNLNNRMVLAAKDAKDEQFVPRKLQPGLSFNGMTYFSYHAQEFLRYYEKNFRQAAAAIARFEQAYPSNHALSATSNEPDYPGSWITSLDADHNSQAIDAHFLQNKNGKVSWEQFKIDTIRCMNEFDASMLLCAGIPYEKIYTHISVEDAAKRSSPREVGIVPSAGNLGEVWWRTKSPPSQIDDAAQAAREAGKGFGIMVANTLTWDKRANDEFFGSFKESAASALGMFSWTKGSLFYAVQGTAFMYGARALLR